jgi:hypothetical protein
MDDLKRQPDPKKTLYKAIGVLVMLGIALSGLIWSVWMLRTLPPAPK